MLLALLIISGLDLLMLAFLFYLLARTPGGEGQGDERTRAIGFRMPTEEDEDA